MLFDPARHGLLQAIAWDEDRVRGIINQIVTDAESRFTPQGWWPPHPRDLDPGDDATQPATPLYYGACDVVWALHDLQDVGAVHLQRNYREPALMTDLMARNNAWLGDDAAAQIVQLVLVDCCRFQLDYLCSADADAILSGCLAIAAGAESGPRFIRDHEIQSTRHRNQRMT
jgi:hypothetical protein